MLRGGIVHIKWPTIGRRGGSVNRVICRHRYIIMTRRSRQCFVSNGAMCARVRIVIAVVVLVMAVAIVSLAISVIVAVFITVHIRFAHIGICNTIRTLGLVIGIPRIYEYGFGVCLSIG